jgi:hypothetical protein
MGLTLIQEAREAGLSLRPEGDNLIIRGPKAAEPLVRRLIENKPAVMDALTMPTQPSPPPPPTERPGHTLELTYNSGTWSWRYRRVDAADLAFAAYVAAGSPVAGVIHRAAALQGESHVDRAQRYRAEWEQSGYPPGVKPKE